MKKTLTFDKRPESGIETRSVRGLEVRAGGDKSIGTLVGYAAVFNSESRDFGGWKEIVKPGAFKNSLSSRDVFALVGHDVNQVIGRRDAGTLTLTEDERGLRVEIALVDTQLGRDILTNVRAGNIDAMSFGFVPVSTTWEERENADYDIRCLNEVELHEVSIVAWPAYEDTSISARDYQLFRGQTSEESTTVPLRLVRLRQAFHNHKYTEDEL